MNNNESYTYMGNRFNCCYLTEGLLKAHPKQQNNESPLCFFLAMLTIPSKPLPSRMPSCSLHW